MTRLHDKTPTRLAAFAARRGARLTVTPSSSLGL
jgi:hypothetical protein